MAETPDEIRALFTSYMEAMAPVHAARDENLTEEQARRDQQSSVAWEGLRLK